MRFGATSRKDDLISLFYLLVFMLNNDDLWVGEHPAKDEIFTNDKKIFKSIKTWKKEHDLNCIVNLLSK